MISSGVAPALKRTFNVPACAGRIHVCDGGIEGDADQLHEPRSEEAALVDAHAESKKFVGPGRGKLIDGSHALFH
jgi:hypothetical protein